MSRTVLIVGIDYWPDVTGIAPYTTQFAEYLAEQGDDVHVITGMPYYPEWKIKHGYDRKLRLTETRNGVTLHRRRQYIPRKQSAIHRAGYEGTFLAQSVLPPRMPKPDLVIGVIPALADGVLSARLAKKYNVPLSLWIQDLMGQAARQSGVSGGHRIATQTARLEGWIARNAKSVGIIAEGFRPQLEAFGVVPDRIYHTPNWSHVSPPSMTQDEARRALSLPLDRKIFLHAGNMGLKQGLDQFVETARLAERADPSMLFVLLGSGSQENSLRAQSSTLTNVRFMAPVSDSMFPNVLHSADVLVLMQKQTVADMSLPSKLTAYFSANKPIVYFVSPESEVARSIPANSSHSLVLTGSVNELLHALQTSAASHGSQLSGSLPYAPLDESPRLASESPALVATILASPAISSATS